MVSVYKFLYNFKILDIYLNDSVAKFHTIVPEDKSELQTLFLAIGMQMLFMQIISVCFTLITVGQR